jgi:hypothetical protein
MLKTYETLSVNSLDQSELAILGLLTRWTTQVQYP